MMLFLGQILLLTSIAYQDFKSRAISWLLLPALFLLALYSVMDSLAIAAAESLKSFLFLILQFVMVYGYFALKFRTFNFQFLDGLLGKGDALFLIVIIPFFTFKAYLVYYSLSMIFALMSHAAVYFFTKTKASTIPLLGWIGLFYLGVFTLDFFHILKVLM